MQKHFDSVYLIKLVSKLSRNGGNDFSEDFEVIKEICKCCGVCWNSHVIKVPADDLNGLLQPHQLMALSTFQTNIVHFFEYFNQFFKLKSTNELGSQIFINNLMKDFEKRAIGVFQTMTHNFINNFMDSAKSNSCLIDDLCSGDLEKTLKLVPSRELACQLGISDQKLRREIYLARQRALKKRPIPKYFYERDSSSSTSSDNSNNNAILDADEGKFEEYFNLEIPTCASPISTVSSSSSEKMSNFDDESMECPQEEGVQAEWSIESLLRSDLYES